MDSNCDGNSRRRSDHRERSSIGIYLWLDFAVYWRFGLAVRMLLPRAWLHVLTSASECELCLYSDCVDCLDFHFTRLLVLAGLSTARSCYSRHYRAGQLQPSELLAQPRELARRNRGIFFEFHEQQMQVLAAQSGYTGCPHFILPSINSCKLSRLTR